MELELHFGDITVPVEVTRMSREHARFTIEGIVDDIAPLVNGVEAAKGKMWFIIGNRRFVAAVIRYDTMPIGHPYDARAWEVKVEVGVTATKPMDGDGDE